MKFIPHLIVVISCLAVPLSALAPSPALITTFTNSTPAVGDYFGISLAAAGRDGMLIGAPYDDTGVGGAFGVGAAYLFNTDGRLLSTFTNPAAMAGTFFGWSLVAVGSGQVLISAPGDDLAGKAYLLSTNGTLLVTFTNPIPVFDDAFGWSVAAMGSKHVLIGAPRISSFGSSETDGTAYLFGTNGTLLTTFTNPTPAVGDYFGGSLAAVGSDRVLIGASGDDRGATNAGTAYLFSTHGTLLTAFTNPTPAVGDYFGFSVAAVGSDRLLIGALGADAAYLFSTNGTLLTTFATPTPAGAYVSVAAVEGDRVLIGTSGNPGVYLFSINGALLTTLTNPAPARNNSFGQALAVLGGERVLIGAPGEDTGATNAGTAYLFSIPPLPSLTIRRTATNTVIVSWLSAATGYALQQNTSALDSVNWSNVSVGIEDNGTDNTLIVNPPSGTNRFYRLFKP